jgi:mannose-6-phosphate isomerase
MEKHERPWGFYEVLLEEENYKVKRITVNPNQKFSYQYHLKRNEYWVISEGSGDLIQDGSEYPLSVGTMWIIPKESEHRACAGPDGLVFIETQLGQCDEEDIVRLQDDYGRR